MNTQQRRRMISDFLRLQRGNTFSSFALVVTMRNVWGIEIELDEALSALERGAQEGKITRCGNDLEGRASYFVN